MTKYTKKISRFLVGMLIVFSFSENTLPVSAMVPLKITSDVEYTVLSMRLGINLAGNGLDSIGIQKGKTYDESKRIKNAYSLGFRAIRLPVKWQPDKNGHIESYKFDVIKKIVDETQKYNMYCIIEIHDDSNAEDFDLKTIDTAEGKKRWRTMANELATAFASYDDMKVILEAGNEPLDTSISNRWYPANSAERKKVGNRLNTRNTIFLSAVRSTGGKNRKRMLAFPTYGGKEYFGEITKITDKGLADDLYHFYDVHIYNGSLSTQAEVEKKARSIQDNLLYHPYIIGESGRSVFEQTGDSSGRNPFGHKKDSVKPSVSQANLAKTARLSYGTLFLWDDQGYYSVLDSNPKTDNIFASRIWVPLEKNGTYLAPNTKILSSDQYGRFIQLTDPTIEETVNAIRKESWIGIPLM